MHKETAIRLLGGTVGSAAEAVRVTPSAVTQWPDELPPRIADRVQAALWRQSNCTTVDTAVPEVLAACGPEK